ARWPRGGAAAGGVLPADASEQQKRSAQSAYKDGAGFLDEGDLERALEAYRRSYDTVASPNSHLMIARVLVLRGDLVAGYLELERVEDEAKRLAYAAAATAA